MRLMLILLRLLLRTEAGGTRRVADIICAQSLTACGFVISMACMYIAIHLEISFMSI